MTPSTKLAGIWASSGSDGAPISSIMLKADFPREMADPRRTVATLRWNPEDVVDIYASLLRQGESYKTIDLPTTPS
jgi:hypothetical protein